MLLQKIAKPEQGLVTFVPIVNCEVEVNKVSVDCDRIRFELSSANDDFNKVYTNLTKIKHYLFLSVDGINNLKKTYHGDIVTDSKLDIIINNCELYIEKIGKKLTNINNKTSIDLTKKIK